MHFLLFFNHCHSRAGHHPLPQGSPGQPLPHLSTSIPPCTLQTVLHTPGSDLYNPDQIKSLSISGFSHSVAWDALSTFPLLGTLDSVLCSSVTSVTSPWPTHLTEYDYPASLPPHWPLYPFLLCLFYLFNVCPPHCNICSTRAGMLSSLAHGKCSANVWDYEWTNG
jgi:hypothetical protein